MTSTEPGSERRIALKRQQLDVRRQSIHQRRLVLRESALQYCRRPSTLGIAGASGFVLARLLPPLVRSRNHARPRPPSRLIDPLVQMISVLVLERFRRALTRRTDAQYLQKTQETHN